MWWWEDVIGFWGYLKRANRMNVIICKNEDRIWSLHRDYTEAKEAASCGNIHMSKPHLPIRHIEERLKLQASKIRLSDIGLWRRDKDVHKKDFNEYMREVASQAQKLKGKNRRCTTTWRIMIREEIENNCPASPFYGMELWPISNRN